MTSLSKIDETLDYLQNLRWLHAFNYSSIQLWLLKEHLPGEPQGLVGNLLLNKSDNYILTLRHWQKQRRLMVDYNNQMDAGGGCRIEMERMLIIFSPQGIFAAWKLTSFWCQKLIKKFRFALVLLLYMPFYLRAPRFHGHCPSFATWYTYRSKNMLCSFIAQE